MGHSGQDIGIVNAVLLPGQGHGGIAVEQAADVKDRRRKVRKGAAGQSLHLFEGLLFGRIVKEGRYFRRIGIAAIAVG